ncbi:hypothetical protein BDN72DRAFT_876324 [Pluteus cervinus]|uniref:Uncharacterized protein n=1 Tax=Pluteus cervinus TaxID=181527 RepID=A0ACD3B4F8_9AGAR|nr:hypothetical protein BDN72DRAFT_876324 [Pluteus cervinus]
MSDGQLRDPVLPARQAAKRAKSSFLSQLSGGSRSTNVTPTDDPSKRGSTKKKSPRQKPGDSKRRSSFSVTKTPKNAKGSTSTPRPLSTQPRRPRSSLKRPLPDMSGSETESSLSSLDSLHNMKTKGKARQTSAFHVNDTPSPLKSCSHPVGSYVWVLMDQRARVFQQKRGRSGSDDDFDDTRESRIERLWWPAKVLSTKKKNLLKLKLLSSPIASVTVVEVENSTQHNVLPLNDDDHKIRFSKPTYVEAPPSDGSDVDRSPRKRQKLFDRTELESRWKAGFAILLEDMAIVDGQSDELPEVQLAFSSIPSSSLKPGAVSSQPSTSIPKKKDGKRTHSASEDGYSSPIETHLNQHHAVDDTLTIPGELILAREAAGPALYWPAKILDCVPAKKSAQLKYHIMYLDNTKAEIARDWFYSSDEPGFATCKVGDWQSHFDDVTVDRDVQEVEIDYRPSPVPMDPVSSGEDFVDLDIREQFVYTKPVLVALLNGKYQPAMKRHEDFMAGGERRQQLTKEAGLRGLMDPKHVEQLGKYIHEWCLRDDRKAQVVRDFSVDIRGNDKPSEDTSLSSTAEDETGCPPVDPPSPASTELVTHSSSPELPPASSFGPDQLSRTESFESVSSIDPADMPPNECDTATEPPLTQLRLDTENLLPKIYDDSCSDLSDLTPLEPDAECELIPRPPPQTGCPDFEALTILEKLGYCTDVLLPEAVIQILLWRSGNRKTMELLSDDEEQTMHDKGTELSKETDWVHDVVRLRESKKRRLEKNAQRKGAGNGRARRVAKKPNYQETDTD